MRYPLRRARGYAPVSGPPAVRPCPSILAGGAELKNTFCLTRGDYAFLSHHIGDLENYETLRSFEDGIEHFERLFRIQPEALACDLHPDYLATRYALERAAARGSARAIGVQHHHAHIAACMAEHGLAGDRPVIGVAFDGTGYGDDGAIWGGEFLLADYAGYRPPGATCAQSPLPGGEAACASRGAWRWPGCAQAGHRVARTICRRCAALEPERARRVSRLLQLERNGRADRLRSPPAWAGCSTPSAALVGVRQAVNYEAQAAIELEALVDARRDRGLCLRPCTAR